jgi:putative hydrolase of the HAD superfamily
LIKAVIFDLGKVIVPFDLRRGFEALASRCTCPPEQIAARIAASSLVGDFEGGRIEPYEFVGQFSALLGLEVSYGEFRDLWSSIFLPETLIPESLLAGLSRHYRLLLLSNTNAIHFEWILERYPLMRHFHDYVLSYQVRALKPAPQIYQAALTRAGCRPEECFYTDDVPSYVEAARQQGMDGVAFCGLEPLEGELRARGVRWQED